MRVNKVMVADFPNGLLNPKRNFADPRVGEIGF
ncbi:hypothetical protein OOU_Y34scaffold00707g4 [Pyricularia oryzae Y34]|uniref:Uncharacterized protein n=2 Tax=Pyricularia oryzae TaxID=318829 RepID=A0AA97NS59_PYRO3|nr:hypothetical protein OOU_Y34scaffold00707g4 [Pyricularia oryzae Y34]